MDAESSLQSLRNRILARQGKPEPLKLNTEDLKIADETTEVIKPLPKLDSVRGYKEIHEDSRSKSTGKSRIEEPKIFTAFPEKNKTYDQAYVINLDKSTDRWQRVDEELTKSGIDHVRFPATNGYKIKLINLNSSYEFFGQELKDKNIRTDTNVGYKVICDPDSDSSTSFIYKGKWGGSAGELGLICSNRIIYQDALDKGYKIIIIFEDDVLIKKPDKFAQQLSDFIQRIPSTFDIAYLDIVLEQGKNKMIKKDDYVYAFDRSVKGHGTWALALSEKGVKKSLSYDTYTMPIDLSYIDNFDVKHSKNAKDIYLEAYGSFVDMVGVYHYESTIADMGR